MTILEAITQADETNKNSYSTRQKVIWLSRVDAMVMNDVISAHEGSENVNFVGYDDGTSTETVLLMGQPYDECYVHWLQAQVYYANDEIDRYNRSMTMFNAMFDDFKSHYKKNHTPKGHGRFRF